MKRDLEEVFIVNLVLSVEIDDKANGIVREGIFDVGDIRWLQRDLVVFQSYFSGCQ